MLEDYTSAPIDEKLRATLGFLRKVTLTPTEVTAGDVRVLLTRGVSRTAVYEALHVCFLFNLYDRLADAHLKLSEGQGAELQDAARARIPIARLLPQNAQDVAMGEQPVTAARAGLPHSCRWRRAGPLV